MEKVFLELMDDGTCDDFFIQDPICAWPIQLLMGFNANTLEKNVLALVAESLQEYISDLPIEPPDNMEIADLAESMVKDEEYNQIKNALEECVCQTGEGMDYELVKNKNPVKFLSDLASFYQLVGDGRVDLDPDIYPINDKEYSIQLFTARRYASIIQEERIEGD
jgi:hypothetical protein